MIAWEAQLTRPSEAGEESLSATMELHNLTTQLISCASFDAAIDTMLDTIVDFHHADFGNVQLYDPDNRALEIAGQRGFKDDFLKTFERVSSDDPCACGRALHLNMPILIEDVNRDPEFAPYLTVATDAGFRAVQSTPMISAEGAVIGVLSTHFREPRTPSAVQMHVTSLYARQAADILTRLRREEAERGEKDLVAKELSHRLKNVLAMVQAIARQSLKRSSQLSDFSAGFEARLVALSRAHTMLSERQWEGASVESLLREQLVAMADKQISLAGPDVSVDADAAYVLTLLTHELAVNAQKYGALSSPAGHASLAWSIDPQDLSLRVNWMESGGPLVAPPRSAGFGTALMRSLQGAGLVNVETRYDPSGVVCAIRVPLKADAEAR